MTQSKKTLALIVLDGWGYREDADQNAILAANTPNLDALTKEYPNTLISGSGLDVGLPEGQMGNSEVGHVNLGAGRVVYQECFYLSVILNFIRIISWPAVDRVLAVFPAQTYHHNHQCAGR